MGNTTQTREDVKLDGIIRDAEEELSSLRREIGRYRGLFDSARLIVGHEFAKPLTSISGYLELLEERFGDAAGEKERGYFAKSRVAVAHLEELVESFVQLLRVEKGAADLQALERVEIRSLLERVRERFEERAKIISVRIEGEVPPVLVRRRCLEVVLENLISNAIKHGGDQGPVRVTASLAKERRGDAKENLLAVTVADHGAGIPEDKIEEIFTPFFRLENGKGKEGLGLGLALVKSIITIMKGEIHVRSKPGEGTAVTILIPVANDTGKLPDTVG
ncbi:MAG: HAMP domain-containing sensor histidine kinase [Candidatus Krumholzibacteriaceae bacterium]